MTSLPVWTLVPKALLLTHTSEQENPATANTSDTDRPRSCSDAFRFFIQDSFWSGGKIMNNHSFTATASRLGCTIYHIHHRTILLFSIHLFCSFVVCFHDVNTHFDENSGEKEMTCLPSTGVWYWNHWKILNLVDGKKYIWGEKIFLYLNYMTKNKY